MKRSPTFMVVLSCPCILPSYADADRPSELFDLKDPSIRCPLHGDVEIIAVVMCGDGAGIEVPA